MMNDRQNTGLNSRPCEQQKDQGWCNFSCIHKVVSNFSTLCSFAGVSLFGAIFFGLTDTLDYRSTKLLYECAHYMVIVAIVLFFIAFLLSFFKEDSKQNSPVDVSRTNLGESVQVENNLISNINTNKLNLMDKLKRVESNTKVKQNEISENIKPTNASTKISKFSSVNKEEEIVARALPISSSCRNADQSKQKETANTLPPNTSSKNHQHAGTKQGESAKILSSHTSSKTYQKCSTSEQCDSAKDLSSSISSKMFQHASISEQKAKTSSAKPRSQSLSEMPSHIDRQLVPYEKHPKIPFYGQNLQTSPPYHPRNFCEFMSPNASGYSPVTEITATKRMTVAPWGVTQEEYQIHQRTFYHVPQSLVGGISPQRGFRSALNYDTNNGGAQGYQTNQTTFYQHPPHLGGGIFSNVSSTKLANGQNAISSSMFNQPRQNKVSDVRTRLQSMNIFY